MSKNYQSQKEARKKKIAAVIAAVLVIGMVCTMLISAFYVL